MHGKGVKGNTGKKTAREKDSKKGCHGDSGSRGHKVMKGRQLFFT